jgi:cytochrome c
MGAGASAVLLVVGLAVSWTVQPAKAEGSSVDDGKSLFEKRCAGCHALDADHEGPRLRGVFGRPAGAVKTFQYSEALQKTKVTWDEAELDKWLTDTESVAPDNDMGFRGSQTSGARGDYRVPQEPVKSLGVGCVLLSAVAYYCQTRGPVAVKMAGPHDLTIVWSLRRRSACWTVSPPVASGNAGTEFAVSRRLPSAPPRFAARRVAF